MSVPDMSNARMSASAVMINHMIYVVGGTNGPHRLDTGECFDPHLKASLMLCHLDRVFLPAAESAWHCDSQRPIMSMQHVAAPALWYRSGIRFPNCRVCALERVLGPSPVACMSRAATMAMGSSTLWR